MTRRWLLFVALSGLAVAPTPAQELQVCVRDLAQVKTPARQVLVAELRLLFPRVDLAVGMNPCDAAPDVHRVDLILLRGRADVPQDVLGLSVMRGGRILPQVEVFTEPVGRLTGTGDLELLGRALGRVAAHELGHYMRQTAEHEDRGPMRAGLTSSELLGDDRAPFVDIGPFD